MSRARGAAANPVPSGAGRTRIVRVSIRALVISLVAAVTGVSSQGSAFRARFLREAKDAHWLWPILGNQPTLNQALNASLASRRNRALSLFACIASLVTTAPAS